MDDILQSLSRDDTQALKETLHRRMVFDIKDKNEKITTDDLEDLFLHASFIGARKCLEYLSEYEIDTSSPAHLRFAFPGYQASPLRAAVENDNIVIVSWLCSHGANVNQLEAIWSCKPDDLLAGKCFSNTCPVACYTPLHFVRSAECARVLLHYGADINVQDCIGKTPLSMATLNGRHGVMEVLCNRGACVDLANKWGTTPLIYAQYGPSKEARVTSTEILLRHNANPNLYDRNGQAPLHVVQDAECLCLLLSYGACPKMETMLGKTPIIIAAENERWTLMKLLYEAEAKISLGNMSRGITVSTFYF